MTFSGKRKVTRRAFGFTTLSGVDESWREHSDGEIWERIRWARIHRTEWSKPTEAARSIGIRPGTYRTYEFPKADGGRVPPLDEIVKIARKYKVSWTWLARGQGDIEQGIEEDERLLLISNKAAQLPPERRDDALNAALSVIDSFARKTG